MEDRDRLLELIDRMGQVSVLLLGDLVLDRFILGTPKRISREAPVIILRHEGQRDIPGGGANALANLVALDVTAVAVGAVGDDEPGHALLAALGSRGADTSRILVAPGFKTPTKVRLLGGGPSSLKYQMARYDIEDSLADDHACASQLVAHLEDAAATVTAIAVSDYGYGAVSAATVGSACAVAGRGTPVCVDSRYRLHEFSGIAGATPNLQELEAATGRRLATDDEVADGAETLRRRLAANFLLATRGNRGMTLVQESVAPLHIPVHGTDEVADVTGAGDTVLAVLVAALAAGATPVEGATLANYAGGIVVMKLGTATVSRSELRSAVRRDPRGIPP
jgi:rfaE bifunctional protein kinase chain/domain